MEHNKKVDIILTLLGKAAYGTIDERNRQEAISRKVLELRQRRGEQGNPVEAIALAATLDRDILTHCGSLAFCEVTLALEWGSRGEYGDYTGVTVDNLLRFVRRYADSDERVEALDKKAKTMATERALPPAQNPVIRNILAQYARNIAAADAAFRARHPELAGQAAGRLTAAQFGLSKNSLTMRNLRNK